MAIADYTEAIRLNPKFAEAYCKRGYAYGNKGVYDKAIADCTKAIRLNPKLAGVHRPGLAYDLSGKSQGRIGPRTSKATYR